MSYIYIIFILESIFSMYLRLNDDNGLHKIYNEIVKNPSIKLNKNQIDTVSCELIIALYNNKRYSTAIEKYKDLDRNGIEFDSNSNNSILSSYFKLKKYDSCIRIYNNMIDQKLPPDLNSYYNIIEIYENGYLWDKIYNEIKTVKLLINNNDENQYTRQITYVSKTKANQVLEKGILSNTIAIHSKLHSNIERTNISELPRIICRTVFRYVLYRNYKRLYNVGVNSLCSLTISSDNDNIIEIEKAILEYSFFPLKFRFNPQSNEIFISKSDLIDFYEYINANGLWLL